MRGGLRHLLLQVTDGLVRNIRWNTSPSDRPTDYRAAVLDVSQSEDSLTVDDRVKGQLAGRIDVLMIRFDQPFVLARAPLPVTIHHEYE